MSEKEEQLRNIAARVGELFADYIIIVRTGNTTAACVSDKTWSLGAAVMYTAHVKDEALLNQIRADERNPDD